MCGRFYVAVDDPELREVLKSLEEENQRRSLPLPPVKTGEVFPTDYAAALVAGEGRPKFEQMRWGFSRHDGKAVIINARAETVLELPTFRKPAAENRCLIPASYYYEWKAEPGLKKKIRHIMRDSRATTIYLAGVFRQEADDDTPRFVILTKAAVRQIQEIHDRMPVILSREQQREWLSREADVKGIIKKSIDERIEGMREDDPE